MGVITDETICAEIGTDWEDVYEQKARERDLRKKLKLPETIVAGSTVADEDELDKPGGEDDGETGDPPKAAPKKPARNKEKRQ